MFKKDDKVKPMFLMQCWEMNLQKMTQLLEKENVEKQVTLKTLLNFTQKNSQIIKVTITYGPIISLTYTHGKVREKNKIKIHCIVQKQEIAQHKKRNCALVESATYMNIHVQFPEWTHLNCTITYVATISLNCIDKKACENNILKIHYIVETVKLHNI